MVGQKIALLGTWTHLLTSFPCLVQSISRFLIVQVLRSELFRIWINLLASSHQNMLELSLPSPIQPLEHSSTLALMGLLGLTATFPAAMSSSSVSLMQKPVPLHIPNSQQKSYHNIYSTLPGWRLGCSQLGKCPKLPQTRLYLSYAHWPRPGQLVHIVAGCRVWLQCTVSFLFFSQ